MKRQAQVQDSRERIEQGLLVSANHATYSQVSNTQIAKAAGVSRMTFYRHFRNKRDVLISLLERLSVGMSAVDLTSSLRRRFEILQEHPTLRLLLSDPEAREIFRDYRWRRSPEILPEASDAGALYRRAFVFAGLDAMALMWLENGMKEPVHDMVELARDVIQSNAGAESGERDIRSRHVQP
ncbi:MAG: TetR/AcrR family transcriptional regulator [Spirochaetaceae bacterium]